MRRLAAITLLALLLGGAAVVHARTANGTARADRILGTAGADPTDRIDCGPGDDVAVVDAEEEGVTACEDVQAP